MESYRCEWWRRRRRQLLLFFVIVCAARGSSCGPLCVGARLILLSFWLWSYVRNGDEDGSQPPETVSTTSHRVGVRTTEYERKFGSVRRELPWPPIHFHYNSVHGGMRQNVCCALMRAKISNYRISANGRASEQAAKIETSNDNGTKTKNVDLYLWREVLGSDERVGRRMCFFRSFCQIMCFFSRCSAWHLPTLRSHSALRIDDALISLHYSFISVTAAAMMPPLHGMVQSCRCRRICCWVYRGWTRNRPTVRFRLTAVHTHTIFEFRHSWLNAHARPTTTSETKQLRSDSTVVKPINIVFLCCLSWTQYAQGTAASSTMVVLDAPVFAARRH